MEFEKCVIVAGLCRPGHIFRRAYKSNQTAGLLWLVMHAAGYQVHLWPEYW